MAYEIYDLGDLVRADARFSDATTATAFDPDTVSVSVKAPDATLTTYVYGTDDEVVNDETGEYHIDIDADQVGQWYYRWFSTGDGQAAEERSFQVRTARAVS